MQNAKCSFLSNDKELLVLKVSKKWGSFPHCTLGSPGDLQKSVTTNSNVNSSSAHIRAGWRVEMCRSRKSVKCELENCIYTLNHIRKLTVTKNWHNCILNHQIKGSLGVKTGVKRFKMCQNAKMYPIFCP